MYKLKNVALALSVFFGATAALYKGRFNASGLIPDQGTALQQKIVRDVSTIGKMQGQRPEVIHKATQIQLAKTVVNA